MKLEPPSTPQGRIGPYTILSQLGVGASATVFLCQDDTKRQVAVKVRQRGVHTSDRRFLREFETMRALRIPGVIRVFEAGIDSQWLWFSMEVVSGSEFLDVILNQPTNKERVRTSLLLGKQLFAILVSLHESGFIHRDLKPSNVLVDEDNNVKVLDFGIARYFGQSASLTGPGLIVGTMAYMAPEQLAGLPLDSAVDMFAAGLMLYEGIAGPRSKPSNPMGWFTRTALTRPQPLACNHRDVPRSFSHLVESLLHVDPTQRPDATQCLHLIEQCENQVPCREWPEPAWCDLGACLTEMDGLIGASEYPSTWILNGHAGTGRRRAAEFMHRQGLLQGVWSLHATCDVSVVGGPVHQILKQLLRGGDEDQWFRDVVGTDCTLLRRMWPDLTLPSSADDVDDELPTLEGIAEAVGRTLIRSSQHRRLLLILYQVEQIDTLTAEAMKWIARQSTTSLGLLLIHDDRWASVLSHNFVGSIAEATDAQPFTLPPITAATALQITNSICPQATLNSVFTTSPQHAVEAGHAQLAAWREEVWEPVPASIWPLTIHKAPIPISVLIDLAGKAAPHVPGLELTEDTACLNSQSLWRSARTRLADLRRAARALAQALESANYCDKDLQSHAVLRLIAGDASGAWQPVMKTALWHHKAGRYSDARRWLMLLETLPFPSTCPQEMRFELAMVRGHVALRTEDGRPRRSLLHQAEGLATNNTQRQLVGVLLSELHIRNSDLRSGLVTALRVASPSVGPNVHVAVQALCVATRARLLMHHSTEAKQQIQRSRESLALHPNLALEEQTHQLEAEWMYLERAYADCKRAATRNLARANTRKHIETISNSSSLLSKVLRLTGKRRDAERHARVALSGCLEAGDLAAIADVRLDLATLLVERGDAIGATNQFQLANRLVQNLSSPQALTKAIHVELAIATVMGQQVKGGSAISLLSRRSGLPMEAPATMIKWWRSQDKVEQALIVQAPDQTHSWGHILWHLERARLGVQTKDRSLLERELNSISSLEALTQFDELRLYVDLLRQVFSTEVSETDRKRVMKRASRSLNIDLYLGALEFNAVHLQCQERHEAAHTQWATLLARAQELGHSPSIRRAQEYGTNRPKRPENAQTGR